jgi:hypothetical protein
VLSKTAKNDGIETTKPANWWGAIAILNLSAAIELIAKGDRSQ